MACPYCENVPGVGDYPVSEPTTDFDRPIGGNEDIVITPTLGMIVPGYFLAISRRHTAAAASLGDSELNKAQDMLSHFKSLVSPLFGEYVLFEHGAQGHCRPKGCIDHAHFHLIPGGPIFAQALRSALQWRNVLSIQSLAELKTEYAAAQIGNEVLVCEDPRLPSQWIRKMVVTTLGLTTEWNWAKSSGIQNLETTLHSLLKVDT